MAIEICDSFAAGSLVPDWLLSIADRPGIPRPTLIFTVDCHIVKVTAGYIIVPDIMISREPITAVNAANGANLTLVATSDYVSMAMGFITHNPPKPPPDDRDKKDDPPPPSGGDLIKKLLTPNFGGRS